MKKVAIFLWASMLILSSCESEKNNNLKIPDGTYNGTFQRQSAFGGVGEISNVTITFSSYTWTGESDKAKYPALCHGKYKLGDQIITFTNECIWTADFDWTLILSGDFNYTYDGKLLEMIRDYRGPSTDTYLDKYILTKEE